MVAVVDETTNLVYLFGEPGAEQKIDEWTSTGAETFDAVDDPASSGFVADFSFFDLEAFVAA